MFISLCINMRIYGYPSGNRRRRHHAVALVVARASLHH
jgi:hypothetical protein